MKHPLLFTIAFLVSVCSLGQNFVVTNGITDNSCSGILNAATPGTSIAANQLITYTLCPEEGLESRVFLDFESISLFFPNTSLVIHDGIDTSAPEIFTSVGLSVDNLPLVLAGENNLTGCLTLVINTPSFVPPTLNLNFTALIGCEEPCQDLFPEVELNGDICSSGSSSTEIFQINQPILFNGSAISQNEFDPELSSFNWIINDVTYLDQQEIEVTFQDSGIYNGNLVVVDQLGCTSETLLFNFLVGDHFLNVSEVNESYTLEELINEILIGGENCSNVSNITSPNNAALSGENFESIGYFNKGCSDFPFEEGVVIGSGSIASVLTNQTNTGGFSWLGVDELTILGGGTPNTGSQSRNATVIEFDFSSFENEVSFNYIFASYEYPSFVCSFADVFAFVVSGPYDDEGNLLAGSTLFPEGTPGVYSDIYTYNSDGNPATTNEINLGGLNVATIPDENGVPVPTTPTNIHNNAGCPAGSLGEFFYPEFFGGLLTDLSNPYYTLSGQTEILSAVFQVIPCTRYKMQLMIADWADNLLDSYVFIEAGSFNIGVDLGEDISANDINSVCYGEEISIAVLGGLISDACEVDLNWLQNGVSIPGTTDLDSINITEPGLYTLTIGGEDGCTEELSVLVDFYPIPAYIDNQDDAHYPNLSNCVNSFNLTVNEPIGLSLLQHNGKGQPIPENVVNIEDLGMEILYFDNFTDAVNNYNPIASPDNYSIPNNNQSRTIYVRVHEKGTGQQLCEEIRQFDVVIAPLEIETPIEINSCPANNSPFGVFDLTQNNDVVLMGLFSIFYTVDYFEFEEDANFYDNVIETPEAYIAVEENQEVWVRVSNLSFEECYDVQSFQLALLSEEDESCDNLSVTNFSSGIRIYPNPTKTFLTIENLTSSSIKTVVMYDLNGKKVGQYQFNSPSYLSSKIDVSDFRNAVYFIEITSENNEKSISRFIKN